MNTVFFLEIGETFVIVRGSDQLTQKLSARLCGPLSKHILLLVRSNPKCICLEILNAYLRTYKILLKKFDIRKLPYGPKLVNGISQRFFFIIYIVCT